MQQALVIIVCTAAIVLGGVVYWKVISTYMTTHAEAIGKKAQLDATSGWSWLMLKLMGWKTMILSWIAGIAGSIAVIPGDVVQSWTGLPWAQVFDQHVAAIISIACGLVIPIFHAQGIAKAATTVPNSTDAAAS